MKKLLLALTFCLFLFNAYAQVANPPTPIEICDDDLDESAVFDLTTRNDQILGGQDPASFTITFYETLMDADTGVNPITTPTSYVNFANPQTVYVRVEEISTGNYDTTTLTLRVFPLPSPATQIPDLEVCDFDSDGFSIFNLTVYDALILNGEPDVVVSYFETESDALINTNFILNPFSYPNTSANQQTIYVRVENTITGCFTVVNFELIVHPSPAAFTPNPLINCDTDNDGFGAFNLNDADAEITGGAPGLVVSYYETLANAQNNVNAIDTSSDYFNIVPSLQTVFARVESALVSTDCATFVNLELIVEPSPLFDISNFTLCEGESALAATGLTSGLYQFQWSLNGNIIPDAIGPSYTITQEGEYLVMAMDLINGCTSTDTFNVSCNQEEVVVMQNGLFTVCEGLFTDSGGLNANYQNNEDFTITLCPENSSDKTELNFSTYLTQQGANADVMTIYDGDSINDEIIGTYSGPNGPGLVTASLANSSGCLTITFLSNSVGNAAGWEAEIACASNCQDITASIDSTTPEINTSGLVVVGLGNETSFTGSAMFSGDGSNAVYNWDFGDGNNATGTIVNYEYTQEGNYTVTLTVEDDNPSGCSNSITIEVLVVGDNLIVDDSQFTVEELVENILIGNDCSSISNITFSTGNVFNSSEPNGIGYFVYEGSDFPFSEGLLISTGGAANASGPNDMNNSSGTIAAWPGDSDLDITLGVNSNNATIIEFDFVPVVDQISFEFLMASEEYDAGSFECNFSDAFAFLLTDSQGNTSNLAVIPGTDLPILVTNIHPDNGVCGAANPEFFGGYTPANQPPIAYDGRTVPFIAEADVNIGENYHIKLVIADDADAAQDSAVFFKAGSFDIGELCDEIGLIRVNAFNDTNANDTFDQNETSFTNGSFTYEKNNDGIINVVNSSNGSFTIVSDNETDFFDITFDVNDDYDTCYSQSLTSFENISATLGDINEIDFPVFDNGACQDLAVYLINPFAAPRPGFDHENLLIIENLSGSTITSGSVDFTIDEDLLLQGTSVSNSNLIVTPNAAGFTLDFVNLPAGIAEVVTISLNTPVSLPLGEIVTNTAVYTTGNSDTVIDNNTSTLSEVVIGSYDPNDKLEAHGPEIDIDAFMASDEYLYYTIRFQNVGTAEAIFVRIEDILDPQLDESTFKMLRSSHDYVVTRTGNNLEWYFDNINLPAEQDDAEGSNGYVYFKIKPNAGYGIGDIIPNNAAIYFDFNPPIITNTFTSTFTRPLSIDENEINSFRIYPNPAKDSVTIQLNTNQNEDLVVDIYDLGGKLLRSETISETTVLNISNLSTGLYFVKLSNSSISKIEKLIID